MMLGLLSIELLMRHPLSYLIYSVDSFGLVTLFFIYIKYKEHKVVRGSSPPLTYAKSIGIYVDGQVKNLERESSL